MDIFLHDFGSYAFTRQLAETLADRGHFVTYAFNASNPGPNQFNRNGVCGAGRLKNLPLNSGIVLSEKKPFFQRLKMELAYARVLNGVSDLQSYDIIISANTPSLVQSKLASSAKRFNVPFVSWVQDLYGYASLKILRKKIPILGSIIGNYFIRLDKAVIHRSHSIIAITDQFLPYLKQLGAPAKSLHVIENWAPINRIPVMPKETPWSRNAGLNSKFRFVYTGTLAMKHNPSILIELAKAMQGPASNSNSSDSAPAAEVLLVSSGQGASYVQQQSTELGLYNIRCLGFQPEQDFPSILGSADVLVALLEEEAAQFSVPSKVLSYFCAGRPILASIPETNLAAETIRKAKAGIVISPKNLSGFILAAQSLLNDSTIRTAYGHGGRLHAESVFDIDRVTEKFESIFRI